MENQGYVGLTRQWACTLISYKRIMFYLLEFYKRDNYVEPDPSARGFD